MSETTTCEPTLKDWHAKEQMLADTAAKLDSENNDQTISAFNCISAEAEAVESQSWSDKKI
jgi:hypothetical protein